MKNKCQFKAKFPISKILQKVRVTTLTQGGAAGDERLGGTGAGAREQ